jgi:hypothetical protein
MFSPSQTDQAYLEKQCHRYHEALADGCISTALDALWRGASAANLLDRHEVSSEGWHEARIEELLQELGW